MSKVFTTIAASNKERNMKEKRLHRSKRLIVWGFNPVTRVKPSKKIYSRKNKRIEEWS